MEESLYIERDKPLTTGLDFYQLRREGIASLQEISGKIWTDYNEHDPGVTMLEQMCYALTSLSFVTETPLQDLLTAKDTGRIDMGRQALFIPKKILTSNPWTLKDYRKLLLDKLTGVGNVWLIPREITKDEVRLSGLYDVLLYIPGAHDTEKFTQEVKKIYAAHRNLCEDLHDVRILNKKQVSLTADIAFNTDASPESILAQIFFLVSQYMSPEVKRYSLEEMQTHGLVSAEDLFEGPLLQNGFIRDNDLQPMQTVLHLNQIEKIILGVKGVENVRNVNVKDLHLESSDKIEVPQDAIFVLNTLPLADKSFTIRFFRGGVEYKPDSAIVAIELERLRKAFNARYNLSDQYEKFFGIPQGQYKPVETYYSIQNQFPAAYGINKFGLSESESPERKAHVRQLKGYLLLFEQLMADFHSQLSHTRDLFSSDPTVKHSYFYQSLEHIVPNVEPLLKKEKEEGDEESLFDQLTCLGYKKGLKKLIESQDPFSDRKNRFLDFLLALYAERITPYSIPVGPCQESGASSQNLLKAKLGFLHHLPEITHDRGKGFDYLNDERLSNFSGMELKLRILLGMKVHLNSHLSEDLQKLGFRLADPGDKKLRSYFPETQTDEVFISTNYYTIEPESTTEVSTQEDREAQLKIMALASEGIITRELLQHGARAENYKIGTPPSSKNVEIVFRHEPSVRWRTLAAFADESKASAALTRLVEVIREMQCACSRVHIIEHNLLRYALRLGGHSFNLLDDDCSEKENIEYHFNFNFHISAIFSGCHDSIDEPSYRSLAEGIVKENTPAHIVATCIWLSPWKMILFEFLFEAWKLEIRRPGRNPALLAELSKDIILFLKKYARYKTGGKL